MKNIAIIVVAALCLLPLSAAAGNPVVRVRCVTEETVIYQPLYLTYEVVQLDGPDGSLTGHLVFGDLDILLPQVDFESIMQSELLKIPSAVQLMDLLGIDKALVARCDIYNTQTIKKAKVEIFAFIDAAGREMKKIGIFGDNMAICSE